MAQYGKTIKAAYHGRRSVSVKHTIVMKDEIWIIIVATDRQHS